MESYRIGALADLIAGVKSEKKGEDLFRHKKKCKVIKDDEETITSKKKRKSIVEGNAIGDVDTTQNAAAPIQKENGEPPVEASAPETQRTSPKKKKKRKSISEDSAIGNVETTQNAITPGQKHKLEENEGPHKDASAPETERTSPKKKKKRKSISEDSAIGNVETTQNAITPGQKHKLEENEGPHKDASAPETERSMPVKKLKSAYCSDDTQGVGKQEMGEESDGDRCEKRVDKQDRRDASQEEIMPREVSSSGLKPSKKDVESLLKKKVSPGEESQNISTLINGKGLSEQPKQDDKEVSEKPEKKNNSNAKNDNDTTEKPTVKKKKRLTAGEKKALKQKRITESIENSLPAKHPDAEERTIFVGNVSIKTKRKKLSQLFKKYGEVETVRVRNVGVADPNMSKKVAVARGMFHPKRTSLNAYVRFVNKESVEKALEANGLELENHHLIVNRSKREALQNPDHSAFIGNLPFEAQEEALFKHFSDCGEIENVRIVRDKYLGSGKGFGFVNFKSKDALEVALLLSGKEFEGRPIRVKRAVKKEKSKKDFATKQKERVPAGQQPKMKLNFMKKTKGKQQEKKEFARKQKKIDFSGVKTSKAVPFNKGKRMKFNQADKKKAFIAQKLVGDGSSRFQGQKRNRFPKPTSSKPISNAE